jgi:hypothetical protein
MFGAHTANVTKTVYLSLVELLSQLFQAGVVTLSMGVDPADDRCIQLLAKVSSYQCEHKPYEKIY